MKNIFIILVLILTLNIDAKTIASNKVNKAVKAIVDVYPNGESVKREYVYYIIRYSTQYNIDPVVVAAVIGTESSFNVKAIHPKVEVMTSYGRRTVRAIGGGVIYELWDKKLIEIGINTKSELRKLKNNIHAVCYIMRILKDRRQINGTISLEESMLLRYYGVYKTNGVLNKQYSRLVYSKI